MIFKILGICCLCAAILLILSQFVTVEYIEEDKEDEE